MIIINLKKSANRIKLNLLKNIKNTNTLLFCILLLAFLLRVQNIRQPYTDIIGWRECSVAMMAENYYKVNPNILYPEVNWNGPGPSYNGREFQTISYISAILYRIFGQHDAIGRMVAVCFGVWGIFALYHLIRRIWDEKSALASAAVMALLPFSIVIDRSFIPEPAMVSLILTGLWMLVAYLQTDKKIYFVFAIAAISMGFLTKITGMLTGLAMVYVAFSILHQRKLLAIRKLLPIIIGGLVILCVVIAYYLWARYISLHYPPYHFAGEGNWLWNEGINSWISKNYFLERTLYLFKNWMWGLPFIVLFLIGLAVSFSFGFIRRIKSADNTSPYKPWWLMHFWLLGCLFFYFIGAQELIFNFHNFHVFSPVMASFAGQGLILISTFQTRSLKNVLIKVLVLLIFILPFNYYIYDNLIAPYHEKEYRMGLALENLKGKNDLVVVIGRDLGSPVAIFYSKTRGWVFPPADTKYWGWYPQNDTIAIQILKNLQQKGALWFGIEIKQYKTIEKKYPALNNYLIKENKPTMETDEFVIFQLSQLQKQ